MRSDAITVPGFTHDVCSSFYPLAYASPVIAALELERWGLRWRRSPAVLAHSLPDRPAAVLHAAPADTADSLAAFDRGDGDAWLELFGEWDDISSPALAALLSPFPPVKAGLRLLARTDGQRLRRLARLALLPARRLGEETFAGEGGRLLLAGTALHTDLLPESSGSGLFGWLLAGLGQQVGFPVPEGGAARFADALVARLRDHGGRLVLDQPVRRVIVDGDRAVGVETASGGHFRARHAVVADVGAPALYQELVGIDRLPARFVTSLQHFQYDAATVKVDWALSAPVPWTDSSVGDAATVHIGDSLDEMSEYAFHLTTRQVPAHPFLLVGQMGVADPTRSPEGTETVWAYTHVPREIAGDAGGEGIASMCGPDLERFVNRIEDRMEARAPGFRDLVLGRHQLGPADLEEMDANLVGGAVNGGTSQLHQQLIFRPNEGWGRATTPIRSLYLASASAHPGGGVHGGPGANAARAAIAHRRISRWTSVGRRRAENPGR